MDSGYYAAYSGLLARSEALDSAASNLSNANTTGFRAEREYFRGAVMGPHALESQLNRTVNDFGVLGGNQLSLSQGALTNTGNALDLAIEGQGFFAIQTKTGIRYTRDGAFLRATNGTLTTLAGEAVMSAQGKPLLLPPGEISIGSDGAVSVAGGVAGQIGVYSFANVTDLTPEGTNRYVAAQSAKPVLSKASLHQGALESSNQDVIQGSLQMILVQRQAEMMQKALSIFHTDFDKTASEDLPRV
ncbi:MAG TPA: flagellar hook basal-body protein [Acidisarcina sp.]|nr:flagellar hook basal-body protein [Acidisarcina sp.]